jgi:hypothetical protein
LSPLSVLVRIVVIALAPIAKTIAMRNQASRRA